MQLEQITAAIRPRSPWEGLDLGFALARHWFPPLWGLWLMTALPVGALCALVPGNHPSLWMLLVWWLKPLYEAPVLFWLSRRLFGDTLGLGALWRARRRILPLRLLPNLLWRRLHLSRSFQLPILLLEGLGGKARARRQRTLQGGSSAAAWLTIICFHLESVLWLSALLSIAFLVPQELPGLDLGAALLDEDSAAYWGSTLLFWLAMSLMAPFYVAAGFADYLTRRTELEAWDLEIVFRQVDRERAHRPRRTGAASAIALLALLVGLSPPGSAGAIPSSPEQSRTLIGEVLAGEDFGSSDQTRGWVYRGQKETGDEELELPPWLEALLESLAQGADLAAILFKWLVILGALTLVALLLRHILQKLRTRDPTTRGRARAPPTPTSELIEKLVPAGLPADITGSARGLIAGGEPRQALALLYGASIELLQRRHGLEVPRGATEAEYLALVADARPAQDGAMMTRLIRAWLPLAYAHHQPVARELDDLLRDWQIWESSSVGR